MMINYFTLSYFVELEIAAWQSWREDRPCGDPALCLPTWGETTSELSWWLKSLGGEDHSWEKKTFQLPVLINLSVSASVPCLISEATFPSGFELWALLRSKRIFFFFGREDEWDGGGRGWPSWHFWVGSQPLTSPPLHLLPSLLGRASPELLLSSLLVVLSSGQFLWSWLALIRGTLSTSCFWGTLQLPCLLWFRLHLSGVSSSKWQLTGAHPLLSWPAPLWKTLHSAKFPSLWFSWEFGHKVKMWPVVRSDFSDSGWSRQNNWIAFLSCVFSELNLWRPI